jgi:hypothetical protein
MKNPEFKNSGTRNQVEQATILQDWVDAGGIMIISEDVDLNGAGPVLGVTIDNGGSQLATIVFEDPFLDFEVGPPPDEIDFDPFKNPMEHVANAIIPGPDYQVIAELAGGQDAIVKWDYGSGLVYYFSNFDVDAPFEGRPDISLEVKGLIGKLLGAPNLNNIEYDELVKVERIVNYNSEVAKMVTYAWE